MPFITLLRFVPAGALKIADKSSDAVAYVYTDRDGRPCARVFYGKQRKPVIACYYRNAAERQASVARAFEGRRAYDARKAARKADAKASAHVYAVGDVLSTCWGYEQTNREFYEVVAVKGASVTVRQISTETVATGDMTARVIPLPGDYVGAEIRKIAQPGRGLKISSCARATPHDFEIVAGVKVYAAVSTSSYH
jgi:hypothetical protein